MDMITDPTFWGEVGLTTASRLAVLAAVVWVARMAFTGRPPRRQPASVAPARTVTAPRNRLPVESGREAPARFVDLRPASRVIDTDRAASVTAPNPLRERLMEYVQQQNAEGTQ